MTDYVKLNNQPDALEKLAERLKVKDNNMEPHVVVFIHGWSVANTDTYGELPLRIAAEAKAKYPELNIVIENIFLGEYISFHNEVRVRDIARALRKAILDIKLKLNLPEDRQLICITHSTGGPVVREWWDKYYKKNEKETCPISHLIMLAPANFGSALAALGQTALGWINAKIKDRVPAPGIGVLEWLELGSEESWLLNTKWIDNGESAIGRNRIFPFVITGDYIDRELVESKASSACREIGSDGVVRAAAANLNSSHVTIIQLADPDPDKANIIKVADPIDINNAKAFKVIESPPAPFLIVKERSHSGKRMGIVRSTEENSGEKNKETVDAIFKCIKVNDETQYQELYKTFATETDDNQLGEQRVEPAPLWSIYRDYYFHDRYAMIIFRLKDSDGFPISSYELAFTSRGKDELPHPDNFPIGVKFEKQESKHNPGVVTYFINYDLLVGSDPVYYNGSLVREQTNGIGELGLEISPHQVSGFVFYKPITIRPDIRLLEALVQKNKTVLVDVIFQRLVSDATFEFKMYDGDREQFLKDDFRRRKPNKDKDDAVD